MTEISFQGDHNKEIVESLNVNKSVIINDVTLREGEQASDVDFDISDKLEVVEKLIEVGINQIQLGYPGRSKIDFDTIKAIKAKNLPVKIEAIAQVFLKDWKDQIDVCIECQPDILDLMYPSSPYRLQYVQNATEEEMLERSIEAIRYAAGRGVTIRFAPTDSCRTRLPFLLRVYKEAVEAGAEIITLTDTAGNMFPASMKFLVGKILETVQVPLHVHCHNDFGLALANTLAAYEGGATIMDASINGYGERAGNTSLDELLTALTIFYNADLNVDLSLLTGLSRFMEQKTRIPVPASKPLVGNNAFAHKLDAHVMGVSKNPIVYETISPETVGNIRNIPIGKYSGPYSIKKKAEMLGISLKENDIDNIQKRIVEMATKTSSSLSDDVFLKIVEEQRK